MRLISGNWIRRLAGTVAMVVAWAHVCPGLAAESIPTGTVVVFNTACARCHEGECSGRMTFSLPENAADAHIRRHGGDLGLPTVRQLGELLRYMKERCAFYPLPLALRQDGAWNQDTLDQLRAPSGTAYYLPLGRLVPGTYRLRMLGLPEHVRPCVELLTADFEPVQHRDVDREREGRELGFEVEVSGELFARVSDPDPITLTRVELLDGPAPR